MRVDQVAQVIEKARGLRSVELAGDRARHPALRQRIDALGRGESQDRAERGPGAVEIAKVLFFIFIVLFLVSLIGGLMRRNRL